MITPAQANRLRQIIARDLRFVGRLCERMRMLHFPPNDPLYAAALRAHHSLQELHVQSHYCGCTSGVGKSPEKSAAPQWITARRTDHPPA
jgi:hypothetical protein